MNANVYEIQIADFIDTLNYSILWFMGETDNLLRVMITLAVIEYVTGIMCLCKKRTLSWATILGGVRQKVLTLTMIGIANIFDTYVCNHTGVLRNPVVVFYISTEGRNILKHAMELGVPFPKVLEDALSRPSEDNVNTNGSL